jgi:pantetheine-phosphate adenylyltransferase
MKNSKAIVAFSGDPITRGHNDIVDRALKVFKHVTVGIGVNPTKRYTFNLSDRLEMAKKVLAKHGRRVSVKAFSGLLVDFAYQQQIGTIIRGVRNGGDVDYEQMLHEVNQSQELGIDTYILFADKKLSHVSSSAAKELIKHNAKNILEYVPLYVKMCMEQEINGQDILGVTGEIGAGKSFVDKMLRLVGDRNYDIKVSSIDLDTLGHSVLEHSKAPFAVETRKKLAKYFGLEPARGGFINPKHLGAHLWGNPDNLKVFNEITREPILLEYREQLRSKRGIILVNSALLAEADMLTACNNNVLLVRAPTEQRKERLRKRGYSKKETEKRMASQLNAEAKKKDIEESIKKYGCGHIMEIDNPNMSDSEATSKYARLFIEIAEGFGYEF